MSFYCFRDVVKLTAQFVARNGRQFLSNLISREKNYQFDFLRPQHSLFNYFTKLVEQYTKVGTDFVTSSKFFVLLLKHFRSTKRTLLSLLTQFETLTWLWLEVWRDSTTADRTFTFKWLTHWGYFTLIESEFLLWYFSLLDVNIKLESFLTLLEGVPHSLLLWAHLETFLIWYDVTLRCWFRRRTCWLRCGGRQNTRAPCWTRSATASNGPSSRTARKRRKRRPWRRREVRVKTYRIPLIANSLIHENVLVFWLIYIAGSGFRFQAKRLHYTTSRARLVTLRHDVIVTMVITVCSCVRADRLARLRGRRDGGFPTQRAW